MFIVLLQRTIEYVIPRKGEALTWESSVIKMLHLSIEEIATSLRSSQ